jgi:glycosyltransferase involved in cell wall biosynthesis
MIAKNAEKTIAKGLQSVVSIAREVIVVINDCTDDTKHIAESYGARVITHDWEGFRDQKNFAIGFAEHDWILSLDSDEALSEQAKRSIVSFIESSTQEYSGAKFPRKTFFLGKWVSHGDWYPDCCLRLFGKGHGKFVGDSVHEVLLVDGKVTRLCGDIFHYPCESLSEFTLRNISYAEMAVIDLFERGRKVSIVASVLRASWRFFRGYVLRLGFLDGSTGYFVARLQSFLTLYKYFRLSSMWQSKDPFLL